MTLRENRLPQQAQFSLVHVPVNPPRHPQRHTNVRKSVPSLATVGSVDRSARPPGTAGGRGNGHAPSPKTPRSRPWPVRGISPTGWVIADDSGLEVDALGGAPGVYSARYAGPDADDEANRQKLVRELRAVLSTGAGTPAARFRCSIAVARGGELVAAQFDGAVEGIVIPAARGEGGFGYDPMFVPNGYLGNLRGIAAGDQKPVEPPGGGPEAELRNFYKPSLRTMDDAIDPAL